MGCIFWCFRFAAMLREARVTVERPPGAWSAYLMWHRLRLGSTPCIGPILAALLALTGSRDTVAAGAGLLAVYGLGLGLPFIAAAAAIGRFMRASNVMKNHSARSRRQSACCSSRPESPS